MKNKKDATYLDYENIPIDAVNAFVAIEDRTFWDNSGIDEKGMIRVLIRLKIPKRMFLFVIMMVLHRQRICRMASISFIRQKAMKAQNSCLILLSI